MAARAWGAVVGALCVVMLAGCTATVNGVAIKSPGQAGEPIVALMDTGSYSTRPGPPPGNAGTDRMAAAGAEARRMAAYVVGPWQVDPTLMDLDFLAAVPLSTTFNAATALWYPVADSPAADRLTEIAAAHGFVAGLTTGRTGRGDVSRLQNVVLRFPDAGAAAAAARELSGVGAENALVPISTSPVPTAVRQPLTSPWQPEACGDYGSGPVHPDFTVSAGLGERVVIRSFTAHGPYVFYQFVIGRTRSTACMAVVRTLDMQGRSIDQFVPTDPAKMADLPQDPSGQLGARTLSVSARTPFSGGVWQPAGWLHFVRTDPLKAQALLASAGVEWVSQALTRVYQARDAAGAGQLIDRFTADTRDLTDVAPTGAGVPGFPAAQCFARAGWQESHNPLAVANMSVYWHFMCMAQAGRYAFEAFSDQEQDVKQQISAQYRILAGE